MGYAKALNEVRLWERDFMNFFNSVWGAFKEGHLTQFSSINLIVRCHQVERYFVSIFYGHHHRSEVRSRALNA